MTIDHISQANVPFYPYLPMGVTNFGGDTQIFTIDPQSTAPIGCALNPQGLAVLNGAYNQPILNNWGYTPSPDNPFMTGMQQTGERVSGNLAAQTINTNLQTIAMAKQRLNAMLMTGNYSDKQKDQINKLLDRLTEEETKLNDLSAETDLTPSELYKKAAAIEKNIRAIVSDISKIGKPGSTSGSSGSSSSSGADDSSDVEETDPAKDEDGDGIGDYPTYSDDALILADEFKKAINYTWGTDDDLFNKVCDSINEDNVIDVMLAWQDNHSLADNESFMTAFFRDADGEQGRVYGRKIANALRLQARELGVFQQCREDFNAIFEELDRTDGLFGYDVDNDIAKHYDNIIKVIAAKKGQPYDTSSFKY